MRTSAHSLLQLLEVASTAADKKASFLQVIANHLELQGPDAKAQVLSILLSKISDTKEEIDTLPVDDQMKKHLLSMLTPFNNIYGLQHVYMNIENAKNHFLKKENLTGLTNIHLALTGHISTPSIERIEAENLAEQFREIAGRIEDDDLPDSLKRALLKRTLKMASILDHYYAFGPEDLQDELEGLVGAMVVSPPPKGSKAAKLYKDLAALSVAGLVILTTVDSSLGKVVSIAENASKMIEYVEDESSKGE